MQKFVAMMAMNTAAKPESHGIVNVLRDNYLILLIFLAGLSLRLFDLGTQSIWFDDAFSITAAKLGFLEQIKSNGTLHRTIITLSFIML